MEPESNEIEPVKFRVVGDNIVVEFQEQEEQTESGIVLAGTEKQLLSTARVVGAGPDAHVRVHEDDPETDSLGRRLVLVGDELVVHRHKKVKLELEDTRELHVFKPEGVVGGWW